MTSSAAAAPAPPAPGFAERPDYRIAFEPCAKRIRVTFGGETLVDSRNARLLHETGHVPVYYFPPEEVRHDLLRPSDRETYCPYKGTARYWSVVSGSRSADNAVWSYPQPYAEVADIAGYLACYWNAMDHWYEEDEEVFVHARAPYVRLDILPSSRPVEIVLGGATVARTAAARFLFETGLPVRYYLPRSDVRMDLLESSQTRSACPYKGEAHYYHARVDDRLYQDVAWCYADPLPESRRIRDLICFFDEHVDRVLVEGREMPRPRTKWS